MLKYFRICLVEFDFWTGQSIIEIFRLSKNLQWQNLAQSSLYHTLVIVLCINFLLAILLKILLRKYMMVF